MTSQTDRGGAQTSFAYNAVNLLVQETDALGQATDYTYNSRGWLTDKDLPDPDGAGPLGRPSSTYGYDYAGNLTSEGQPNYEGVPLQYTYDAAGRRTQRKHQGDTFSTTYTYDNLNRLIKEVDPLLCSTSYTYNCTYDYFHRLTQVSQPGGGSLYYSYDAAGKLLSLKDPAGQ